VKNDTMKDLYLVQMREMAKVVYDAGLMLMTKIIDTTGVDDD